MGIDLNGISAILLHQLRNYWTEVDKYRIRAAVPIAIEELTENYRDLPNKRFWNNGLVFSPYVSVQWMNFLYRVSHILYKKILSFQRIRFII